MSFSRIEPVALRPLVVSQRHGCILINPATGSGDPEQDQGWATCFN